MYGPPPDPLEVAVALPLAEFWPLYALSICLGLTLSCLALVRRLPDALRALAFVAGQVTALTAPLSSVLGTYVYGSWPTIDKTGSLLFYLDGVHRRLLLDPLAAADDPAVRLIGVHAGHLWVTELFDLVLPTFGAFNAQVLLYCTLGWWGAALFARRLSGDWRSAVIVGFPFGMGLHVFRDYNWYTIEKASVGLLALFAWALWRSWEDGGRRWPLAAGALYLLMALVNWYLALVGAFGAAFALLIACVHRRGLHRGLALACAASALLALPLVLLQGSLLSGSEAVGDPETYLTQRAMLDTFSLVPLAWNRLELHRALNLPVLALALLGLRHPRGRALALIALFLWLLALGPKPLDGVWNPLYMGLRAVVPGFWRVAKPEVFFEGSYLCLIGVAAQASRGPLPRWTYGVVLAWWLLLVRTHPVFPGFTSYQAFELDPRWTEHLGLPGPEL